VLHRGDLARVGSRRDSRLWLWLGQRWLWLDDYRFRRWRLIGGLRLQRRRLRRRRLRLDERGLRLDGRGLRLDGRGLRLDGRGLRLDGRGLRLRGRGRGGTTGAQRATSFSLFAVALALLGGAFAVAS